MPPVILDKFHGLGRVVDAPLGNGSIERIPFLLRYGGLLVPITPNDDRFRVESREYRSFVIGEKLPELLLRAERDALANFAAFFICSTIGRGLSGLSGAGRSS